MRLRGQTARASAREKEAGGLDVSWAEEKGKEKRNGPRGDRIAGLKERQGEGRRVLGFFLFKFFSNSFFKLFKLHSRNKTMHSNHDAQALIISNIIEMMFKYFKGQFI
jgi:hypothetical protein